MHLSLVLVVFVLGVFAHSALGYHWTSYEKDSDEGGTVKVYDKTRNVNVNDINIGGQEGSGDLNIPCCGGSSDHSDGSDGGCSGKKDKKKKYKKWWKKYHKSDDESGDNGDDDESPDDDDDESPDQDDDTETTVEPTTTTVSPFCKCEWTNNGTEGDCEFHWSLADQQCKHWDFSACQAVCSVALTTEWRECSPEGVKNIKCSCPIMKLPERHFPVPDIHPESNYFYTIRYETCETACKNKKHDKYYKYKKYHKSRSWSPNFDDMSMGAKPIAKE